MLTHTVTQTRGPLRIVSYAFVPLKRKLRAKHAGIFSYLLSPSTNIYLIINLRAVSQ